MGRVGGGGGGNDLSADAAELGGLLLRRCGGVEDAAYVVLHARVIDTCKARGMYSALILECRHIHIDQDEVASIPYR